MGIFRLMQRFTHFSFIYFALHLFCLEYFVERGHGFIPDSVSLPYDRRSKSLVTGTRVEGFGEIEGSLTQPSEALGFCQR